MVVMAVIYVLNRVVVIYTPPKMELFSINLKIILKILGGGLEDEEQYGNVVK